MLVIVKKSIVSISILALCLPFSASAVMQSSNYKIYEANLENTAGSGPVITYIGATTGETTANISWNTDTLADAFVQYDTDSGLANSKEQGISAKTGTGHNVTVGGLSAATTYYFRIKSTNLTNGTTIDPTIRNFTTAAAVVVPPVAPAVGGGVLIIDKNDKVAPKITKVSVLDVRANSATIGWETDEDASSFVEYYQLIGGKITSGQWDAVKNHRVVVSNLLADTEYSYMAMSGDGSGNLATSSLLKLKTLTLEEEAQMPQPDGTPTTTAPTEPAKPNSLQAALKDTMDAINRYSANISTGALEVTLIEYLNGLRGIISGIPAPSVIGSPQVIMEGDHATVTWQTDKESGSQLAFATAEMYKPGQPEPYYQVVGNPDALTKGHQVVIYGLTPGKTYHYQLRNRSALGVTAKSIDYIFKSAPEAPGITNYYVDVLSPEKAIFRWLTNQDADTSLRIIPYRGTALAVSEAKAFTDKTMSIIHQLQADTLEGGVVYQVELSGKTKKNEVVNKVIENFSTSKDDLAPIISQVRTEIAVVPGREEKTQTIITWQTNEPATSQIYYRIGAGAFEKSQAEKTTLDNNYIKRHVTLITKFKLGEVYSFRVESTDTSGNSSLSQVYTVMIPKRAESIFEIILRILLQTFGWVGRIGA